MRPNRPIVRLPMVLGSLALAATLAACGGSSTSSDSTSAAASEAPAASASTAASAAPAASEAPAGGIDVGVGTITPINNDNLAFFVQATETYSFSVAQAEGAKQAAKDLGVNLDVYWSGLDPALELSNYQQAISGGKYGGLVIQPVTTQLCQLIPVDAVKYQVLVEIIGTPVCVTGKETGDDMWAPGTTAYVDQQNMFPTIIEMMNSAKAVVGDGPKNVMMILGNEGHGNVVAFEEAWKSFAAESPDWKLVNKVYTDWTAPGAYTATQNALQADPNVDVILTSYVDITTGVVKAIADQKLTDKIQTFETSGGSEVSVDMINKGQLTGSMPQLAFDAGYRGVAIMVDTLNGTQPAKFNPSEKAAAIGLLTKDNVASFTPDH